MSQGRAVTSLWASFSAAALVWVALLLTGAWLLLDEPPPFTSTGGDFEHALDAGGVRVVVLGSSMAESHVDPALLAEILGLPPGAVAVYGMPHSSSAHWFAAWRRRMQRRPEQPELVVLLGSLGQMLQADVIPGLDEALYLGELEPDPAPELLEPLGSGEFGLRRAIFRVRLGMAIEDALAAIRRTVARAAGVEEALARQFQGGAFDAVVPALDVVAMQDPATRELVLSSVLVFQQVHPVDETLLPRLMRELREAGTVVALVRAPTRPDVPEIDDFPDDVVAEVAEAAAREGAAWLDLRDLELPAALFRDPVHLDEEGARVFTRVLADRLRAAGLPPEGR